jgi:hypothetical protein
VQKREVLRLFLPIVLSPHTHTIYQALPPVIAAGNLLAVREQKTPIAEWGSAMG